jgi:general secretion pathway protein D
MRISYRFTSILAAGALLVALGSAAGAGTRKGDKFLRDGRIAEQRKEWDKALELYESALAEDPADVTYQMGARRVRFQSGQAHVDLGQKLRDQGKLDQALAEFQKAYAIDPSSSIAEQELKRTLEMIERNKKAAAGGEEIKPADLGLTPADLQRKHDLERIARIEAPPELKPLSRQPISLRMTNQPPKVLFETVGKLAGVNVVFDPEYQNDPGGAGRRNISVELNNATLEDALDYLGTMTKSYWKPLSANAIFVTIDNQAKRRDYEDYVVKVFYLGNLTTPQELQEIQTALRTVAGIRYIFQYTALNALIIRGTTDQVMLAQKLVNDLDKPKSEVVVDVLVMEASKTKTRDLAAALTSGGTAGLNVPIGFTPRNPVLTGSTGTTDTTGTTTTTTSQLISLARIAHVSTNDFSLTLPGALLKAMASDSNTKILQSPQVRAASGQKATLRIGDKVPVASGGMQPFGGTTGGFSSLYSSFTFVDVGVNVDITPTVHGNGEVTLKVIIETSTVKDHVDIGGISQPIIGQRKVEHEIRIKEGEVSLLGGLMQDQDTKALSGIPGLMNIPILKRLFSSESITKGQSELMIALIPHIVRTPGITDVNLRSVAAGTDAVVKLGYVPQAEVTPAAPAAPGAPPVAIPGATAPAVIPTPSTAQPVPAPAPPTAPAAPPVQPAAVEMRFSLQPGDAQTQAGGTVTLELRVANASDLFAAPFHVKFDPQLLRLTEVKPGALLSGDGRPVIFTRNILNDTGDATVNLNRTPGTGGVSGSGSLAVLTFQAVKSGKATVTFSELAPRDARLQPVAAGIPQAVVTIR